MKSPIEISILDDFVSSLDNEKERMKFLDSKKERYVKIYQTYDIGNQELFEGSIYDLLFDLWELREEKIKDLCPNFDISFYKSLFNDANYIKIRINDWVVSIKKPNTLKEMSVVKKLIATTKTDELDDFTQLQRNTLDFVKLYQGEIEIKNVDGLSYEMVGFLYFVTPIIYDIYVVFTNSLFITKK